MLLGRVIFGIGGEIMYVSKACFVTNWFKGKELAFSFGVIISVSRLGSVLNSNTVPENFTNHGLGYTLMIGLVICGCSLLSAVLMSLMDKLAET